MQGSLLGGMQGMVGCVCVCVGGGRGGDAMWTDGKKTDGEEIHETFGLDP